MKPILRSKKVRETKAPIPAARRDEQATAKDGTAANKGSPSELATGGREMLEVPDKRKKGLFDIVAQNEEASTYGCEKKKEQSNLVLHASSDFVDDPDVPPLI